MYIVTVLAIDERVNYFLNDVKALCLREFLLTWKKWSLEASVKRSRSTFIEFQNVREAATIQNIRRRVHISFSGPQKRLH